MFITIQSPNITTLQPATGPIPFLEMSCVIITPNPDVNYIGDMLQQL